MIDQQNEIREDIVTSLKRADRGRTPRTVLEELLRKEYSERDMLETLQQLLDEYVIDLVIDYRVVDHSCEEDEIIWYVKLLSPEEREYLQSLPPVKRALLRVMHETHGENIGKIPVEEAEELLKKQGFSKSEAEWLSIEDRIDWVETDISRGRKTCYRLVPEYERTEEYKREREAENVEWIRTDLERRAAHDKAEAEAERRLRRRKKKK